MESGFTYLAGGFHLKIISVADACVGADGRPEKQGKLFSERVLGSTLHALFANDAKRRSVALCFR